MRSNPELALPFALVTDDVDWSVLLLLGGYLQGGSGIPSPDRGLSDMMAVVGPLLLLLPLITAPTSSAFVAPTTRLQREYLP